MIPDQLLRFTESRINTALATDTLSSSGLSALSGKVFAVECDKPQFSINIRTTNTGVVLTQGNTEEVSVMLSGSLPALIKFAGSVAQDNSDYSSSGVEIRGDVGALLQLGRVLSCLDIDWEELVSRITGEIPARLIFQSLAGVKEKSPQIKEKLKVVSARFVSESELFASVDRSKALADSLRELNYRIDRIEARIAKLQSLKSGENQPQPGTV